MWIETTKAKVKTVKMIGSLLDAAFTSGAHITIAALTSADDELSSEMAVEAVHELIKQGKQLELVYEGDAVTAVGKLGSAANLRNGQSLFSELESLAGQVGETVDKGDYYENEEWDLAGLKSDIGNYKRDVAAAAAAARPEEAAAPAAVE